MNKLLELSETEPALSRYNARQSRATHMLKTTQFHHVLNEINELFLSAKTQDETWNAAQITVRKQLISVREKLGAATRKQAVAIAFDRMTAPHQSA